MYVEDVDDLVELEFLLADAEDRLAEDPANEQARWDVEDIEDRIQDVRTATYLRIT
ncbi:hypothetical protein SEA_GREEDYLAWYER_74 [Mycobacterium phage GreedyLawyer]|uniref:Uncharacterized protein n=2 Tax=Gladiatorvirus ericB TaxID=1041406 RepID=G1EBV0_9CAUD|nr:hypothetical protein AXJ19_gp033 [Mycobacterium phage VohminGhazi]YP_009637882.1 hypothetical protein FGG32_gp031 [Mycobacterium phage EricB]AMW64428.1 hypothetical protein PBI_KAZAN_80 [Mycobacterium phage Kazan]AVR76933.1 hypothetical protein SEA_GREEDYLAWYER_74 [Mycobacterium phage GreedyLawyer]QXO14830.1 hypothetical protein SEA_SMELLYB_79 [Mycobacterium phage SmellyB]QYW01278.1 hypothetical protein SEA_HOOT_74 [Mycobacterium phage Hoot]AEJ93355.1 hypothetical protein ERICB_78 [Mycobac